MAISYNDWKKQYEALDSAGKQKYADLAKSSALWQQYMNQYNSEISKSKLTNTVSNYPASNTSISSYQSTTPTKTTVTKQASNNASVGTWAVAWMNNQVIIPSTSWSNQTGLTGYKTEDPRYSWYKTEDPRYATKTTNTNAQYSTQDPRYTTIQYKTEDPRYANNGNQYKTENPAYANKPTQTKVTTPTTNKWNGGTYVSPKQQERDYQDNSQARMDQIADNLNKYTQTNPDLFKDYDTFYNFFIAWKGRSEDQKRFLDQYYANYKRNEKYGNMTPEELGTGMANWTVPEDYINTVNATDPNKAAAIKDSLKDAQDWIANEWYLSELAGLSWFHAWNAKEMLYRDENNDWLDDRVYHAASEEEKTLVEENSGLESERLKLSNAYRDLQSDLTKQYPDADLSTIMLLTADRGQKIQKALDTLNVTQTRVQGTLKYLQTERETMDKAWQNTIAELQKNYGIYMEYSPEWIKERTQAEYEATHITLDQADSWTETDKQMALQWVLDWYYNKYWDIIQRSEQQVINDVIATAKKEWISLSDALEKNFLKPLRAKPWFQQLSTITSNPNVTRIGTDSEWNPVYWYYDENTGTFKSIYDNMYWDTGTWSNGMYNFSDYTPMSSSELEGKLNSFESDHPVNSKWGQCWAFVNDYLQSLGLWRLYTDPIDKKLAVTNSEVPVVWGIAVMSSEKYPQYWHTAIIKDIKEVQDGKTMVQLLESNRWDDEKVHTRRVNADKILWVFDPTKQTNNNNASSVSYDPNMTGAYNQFLNDSVVSRQKDLAKQYGKTYDQFRAEAEAYAEDRDANAMKPIVDAIDYILSLDSLPSTWDRAIASWEWSWAKYYKAVVDPSIAKWASKHNLIYNTVWMDKFLWLKSKGATFWALSEWEREAIYRAATDLDPTLWEDDYREALSNLREQIVANSHWMLNWYWAAAQARQANYIADSLYWDLY